MFLRVNKRGLAVAEDVDLGGHHAVRGAVDVNKVDETRKADHETSVERVKVLSADELEVIIVSHDVALDLVLDHLDDLHDVGLLALFGPADDRETDGIADVEVEKRGGVIRVIRLHQVDRFCSASLSHGLFLCGCLRSHDRRW